LGERFFFSHQTTTGFDVAICDLKLSHCHQHRRSTFAATAYALPSTGDSHILH